MAATGRLSCWLPVGAVDVPTFDVALSSRCILCWSGLACFRTFLSLFLFLFYSIKSVYSEVIGFVPVWGELCSGFSYQKTMVGVACRSYVIPNIEHVRASSSLYSNMVFLALCRQRRDLGNLMYVFTFKRSALASKVIEHCRIFLFDGCNKATEYYFPIETEEVKGSPCSAA